MSFLCKIVALMLISVFNICPIAAKQLEGGVEHSVVLPPVAPELRAGSVFNESSLPDMGTTTDWYWIPSWYAGSWQREREKQTYYVPMGLYKIDRMSKTMSRSGFQRDRQGGIWNYRNEPFKAKIESSDRYEFKIVRLHEPIQVTDEKVVFRGIDSSMQISKLDGRIIRVYQQESISTYKPKDAQRIKVKGSVQVYDEFGKPTVRYETHFEMHKLAEYSPINVYHDKDMRQDFRLYLKSRGLGDLVPDDLRD